MASAASPTTLATVISAELQEHSAELWLHVDENLAFFDGHFPDFPLVPGVAQIAWAVHFTGHYLHQTPHFNLVERLKFTSPIRPGVNIQLSLAISQNGREVNFRYHQGQTTFSQGRLRVHEQDL